MRVVRLLGYNSKYRYCFKGRSGYNEYCLVSFEPNTNSSDMFFHGETLTSQSHISSECHNNTVYMYWIAQARLVDIAHRIMYQLQIDPDCTNLYQAWPFN